MTELELSYSKIKAWRFCRQSYDYRFIERIVPRLKPRPLEMGSVVHSMIEDYRKGKNWKTQLTEFKRTFNSLLPEEKEHFGNLPEDIKRIIEGYIKHYKEEDRGLKYHLIEDKIGPLKLIKGVTFFLTPDCLAEDTMGKMLLVEVKTGRNLPPSDFRIWDLQTLLYVWGLREAGYTVNGVLWDHIRTKAPTIPRVLKDGTISKREIDTDYDTFLSAITAAGLYPSDYSNILARLRSERNFYIRHKLPVKEKMLTHVITDVKITAEEIRDFGKNIIRDISQSKCPRCMYRSLCEAVLLEGDEEYVKKKEFIPKIEEGEENTDESKQEE